MMKIFILIILSILAGCLYRAGGSSEYDTKFRDFGVPVCATLYLIYLEYWHWSLIPSFFLLFASLTTYHRWVQRIFKKNDDDAEWYNWLATGLGYGISILPFAWSFDLWGGFCYRVIFLGVFTLVWSVLNGNVIWEEFGRGAAIVLTLPLLFL